MLSVPLRGESLPSVCGPEYVYVERSTSQMDIEPPPYHVTLIPYGFSPNEITELSTLPYLTGAQSGVDDCMSAANLQLALRLACALKKYC